jgi:hypothetical protein
MPLTDISTKDYVLQRAMVQAVGYQQHFLMSIVAQQIPMAWGSDANPQERKYFTASTSDSHHDA